MDTEQYDIFLSYRRRGGFETAKLLYDLLTRDGYSVSFDIDTLRSGDFDTALLQRIDQCTDFILIVDKNAFDRTLDPTFDRNKDWMRIELARALEKGKNIIPVMLDGVTDFPDNLPADIASVRNKNIPKYSREYFDAFYKRLLENFLDSRPSERRSATPSGGAAAGSSTLKIRSDADCRIFVDDEERGIAHAGRLFRLPLRGGSYILRFVSIENHADTVEETLHIERDVEELYSVALLPVKRQREERRRREAYLLQLPDERFRAARDDGGAYGFVDRENDELLIPYAFDSADDFSEGLAPVKKNGKWGYIDKTGKTMIPTIYDDINFFREGLASVEKDGKWGFTDKTGKVAIPFIYDAVNNFSEGLAAVKKDGYCGYIDKTGKMVIPTIYDAVNNFSEGLASVEKDGYCGYIDKTGKMVIPTIYNDTIFFTEGLAAVKKSKIFGFMKKWGYIDKTGRVAIPFVYDLVQPFSEGLAAVKKDGKWGYIDKTGRWVKDDD